MRPARQRGQAMLVLVALVAMGATWGVVSALNAASNRTASDREHNARVLLEAKAALIGWIAANALEATEGNPGRLPCPQAWGDVGGSLEGRAASSCSQPAIGWLPWRTLGLPVMRDAAGQQLWYAISPGWHLPNGSTDLTINSNTAGGLSLNGQAAVALLIAPGRTLNIAPTAPQIAAGCTARNQSHTINLPSTAPSVLDYLECANGSSGGYSYSASVTGNVANPVLNDQIVAVTTADILPALEAAIAKRIERDIVPQLKDVFVGPDWGLSSGVRMFAFAAPFADPTTSSFVGSDGNYQGLLPFSQVQNCTAGTDPRCLPDTALHSFTSAPDAYDGGGWGYIQTQSCSWEAPNNAARVCEGEYHESAGSESQPGMRIEMQITLRNVAMALRFFDATRMQVDAKDDNDSIWITQSVSHALTMSSDGSLTIRFWSDLPNIDSQGWGTYADYRIRIERLVVSDHPLLSSTGRIVNFGTGTSEIKDGDTVTGVTSGASGKAKVVRQSGTWGSDAAGILLFTSVSGTFVSGEQLQVGGTPRATSTSAQADIGWFVRNEWFRLLYYATAASMTADGALPGPSCTTDGDCLRLVTWPSATPVQDKRAMLIVAGRALTGQTRPSSNRTNYVEFDNNNVDTLYEQQPIRAWSNASAKAPFNDRVVVLDANP